jgi:membrane associated rhomboid family serine protease
MAEELSQQNPEKKKRVTPGKASDVVKFIIGAIVLIYIGQIVSIAYLDFQLHEHLALYNFQSENFALYQFITYLFVHAGFLHLFLNMFILWIFGSALEIVWNSRKFLFYFFFTGAGAALLHLIISTVLINQLQSQVKEYAENPTYNNYAAFVEDEIGDDQRQIAYLPKVHREMLELKEIWAEEPQAPEFREKSKNLVQGFLNFQIDMPSVGASGAVFGILLAFGMLFPNNLVYIYFMFPMKAKYFVILLGALELYLGVFQDSNVANFAHLGGMVFGFILLKLWGEKARKLPEG